MSPDTEILEAELVDDMRENDGPPSRALVTRRESVGGLIRPVAQPSEVLQAQEDVRTLVEQALKAGRDYDTIPGTGKPTLLKPGAERINAAFGCATRYEITEREVDHDRVNSYVKRSWEWHPTTRGKKVWSEEEGESQGLYRYVLLCQLVHRESGVVIGEGVGSCSTMESKYIDRPRDLENTVLKMAKKRAFVDATLTTFGLSEQFTQDVEDMGGMGGGSEPFSLDATVSFGKHKGSTWAELVESEPGYVDWAIENMDKLRPEDREILKAARKAGSEPTTDTGGPPASENQTGLIERLVKSSVFSDDERDKVRRRVLAGMTKDSASDAIEWLQATMKLRKAEAGEGDAEGEAEGGNAEPDE